MFQAHNCDVTCVAANEQDLVVTGCADGLLRVWRVQAATSNLVASLSGHTSQASSVCWLGNDRLVSGSDDMSLLLWEVGTQTCVGSFTGHSAAVVCVAHLRDGRVVSGSADSTLRLWYPDTQACVGTLAGHTDAVTCMVEISNHRLVSGGADTLLRVWDLVTQECLAKLPGHIDPIFSLVAMRDNRVVSTATDSTLKLWDLSSNVCIVTGTHSSSRQLTIMALGPDQVVGCTSSTMDVTVWDVDTLKLVKEHAVAGLDVITCHTVLSDGRVLVGDDEGRVQVVDVGYQPPRVLLAKLQRSPADAGTMAQLLAHLNTDVDAGDVSAILSKDMAHLHRRWSVLRREPLLREAIQQACAPATASWLALNDAIDSGAVSFEQAVQAFFGANAAPQQLVALQLQLNGWPLATRWALKAAQGCDVSRSTVVADFVPAADTSLQMQQDHSQQVPLVLCFDPTSADKGCTVSQDASSVVFRARTDSRVVAQPLLVPSVTKYHVTLEVTTRGALGTQIFLQPGDSASGSTAVQLKLQGSQSRTFRIESKVGKTVVRATVISPRLELVLDMRKQQLTVLNSAPEFIVALPPGQLQLGAISCMPGASVGIVHCTSEMSPTTGLPMHDTERLQRQAQLVYALLGNMDNEAFHTPGVAGQGHVALDSTLLTVLKSCHPQVLQDADVLRTALKAGLPLTTQKILESCADAAVLSARGIVPQLAACQPELALRIVRQALAASAASDGQLYDTGVDLRVWEPWLKKLQGHVASDVFSTGKPDLRNPESHLMLAFAMLQGSETMRPYALECFQTYLQNTSAGKPPSRMGLLFHSRLLAKEGKTSEAAAKLNRYLLLGWEALLSGQAGAAPPEFGLQDSDTQLLQRIAGMAPTAVQEPPVQPYSAPSASQRWASVAPRTSSTSTAMTELMALVGMEEVKAQALQVFLMMDAWKALPAAARVPVTLNFAFMGNPGTGKTTAARLFGKLLHQVGARRQSTFIEKSAAMLKREGSAKLAATIDQAMGGVLFIDEAYQLDPARDTVGREIIDELLMAAENHREDLTIILAGYKDEIEKKLYAYNTGMVSRFEEVIFADFHDRQLRNIWDLFLTKHSWQVADPSVSDVVIRRVARQRSSKGFGNARAVRTAFQAAVKAATTRWGSNRTAEQQCIIMEDVLGTAPSRSALPELDEALRDLDQLTGMSQVKAAIHQLVETAAANYGRELRGQPVLPVALNRLMLGNPGTGKTTVAAIYARVLKALGLVSKGSIELKTASDFVGEFVGQTSNRTASILDVCKGKVLVIDEAYNLNDNLYGKQAIDTIVEKVMGSPGEDIAVLMLGYEKQMLDMLREQNPGLARRFNPENALMFNDYDESSLAIITADLCKSEHVTLTYPVLQCIVDVLMQQRALPNFGNAGAVRNLLSRAKARMLSRVGTADDTRLTVADVVGENRDAHGGMATGDPLQPIRELFASNTIVTQLEALQKYLSVQRREGRDVSAAVGNWLFMGNPGTGKTTVAKCMARMLRDLGVLASDKLEMTSAADLTGAVVGAAKGLVAAAMGRARGGVLFIDEAYELGVGMYGQEAMAKLVEMLTLDEYRKGTVVIMAGYADAMQQMLQRNQGLASRFQRTVKFPDWTPTDSAVFVHRQMLAEGYTPDTGVQQVLQRGFEELCSRPGWANARDATSVWRDRILFERTKRVYESDETQPRVTLDDVEKGMADLLATRPKGVPCRHAHATQMLAEQLQQQTSVDVGAAAAPREATSSGEEQRKRKFEADEEHKDELREDDLTEEELTRLRREADDAETRAQHRLKALREAAAAARLALEAARRRNDAEAAKRAQEELDAAEREAAALQHARDVQRRLRELGRCVQNFEWIHLGNGNYQCAGGSHTMHLRDLGL